VGHWPDLADISSRC
jgi:aromatic amino acid aminotransferase I